MPPSLIIIVRMLLAVILLVTFIIIIADVWFKYQIKKEITSLLAEDRSASQDIITPDDLEGLPPAVRKWLENSQVVGKERIATVRLNQKGLMRTKEGQPWMSCEAQQYITTDKPGFIWQVRVKAAPLVFLSGRDKYYDGRGNMLIKLYSLIPVANAGGTMELDQGTLLRYLGEIVWVPTVALNSYIKWEEVDATSAKATMTYNGVTGSGVFIFNEQGQVVQFIAERYMESNGKYVLENWSVLATDHKQLDGIIIPTRAEVVWKFKTGDFSWYQLEITDINYNAVQ